MTSYFAIVQLGSSVSLYSFEFIDNGVIIELFAGVMHSLHVIYLYNQSYLFIWIQMLEC